MKSSLIFRVLRAISYLLLAIFGLGAIGCLFPTIPVLGEVGPILLSNFGPWLIVVSLFGAVLVFRRWHRTRKKRALIVTLLALLAAVVGIYASARQIAVARANGVQINLAEAFFARSQADASLRPVTVIYSAVGGEKLPLEIYRPASKPAAKPTPVFIYIHGGGWGAETLRQRQADYRWFAQRGYLVVSLEYSLSSETRHTWNVAEPELGCALAWVGSNAARFGGDPARIALWGESAGGNLVLNLSYRANKGTLTSSCPGTVPHIAATMALYPVVDPARMHANPDPLIGVFGRMMTENYTGGTPASAPDRYAAITSVTHISSAAPPTLLIVPEADHLVVPQAAYDFAAKASAAGVETQVIRMPYAEHSFDLRSGSIGNQLVRQAMLRFLQRHGMGVK